MIDFTGSHVETVIAAAEAEARDFVTRLGYGGLLDVGATGDQSSPWREGRSA